MPAVRPKLHALTGLRFFAALYVVSFHFAGDVLHGAPAWARRLLVESGFVGVDLFFVLSGFVLAYTYLNTERPLDRSRFWTARFARIYPVYLLAVLLMTPFNVVGRMSAGPHLLMAAKTVFCGSLVLLLIQSWVPGFALIWNAPGWTLSVEAFFYALFPVLARRVAFLERRSLYGYLALCWSLTIAWSLVCLALLHVHPLNPNWMECLVYNPVVRLPEFLIGAGLGALFLRSMAEGPLSARRGNYLAAAGAAGIVAAIVTGADAPYAHHLPYWGPVFSPLFGLLIYGLAHQTDRVVTPLSTRWMVQLGEASYALYILQMPLAYWMNAGHQALHGVPAGHYLLLPDSLFFESSWFWLGSYTILLVGLSLLSLRFLETPAREAIRRRAAHRRVDRTPAGATAGPITSRHNPDQAPISLMRDA